MVGPLVLPPEPLNDEEVPMVVPTLTAPAAGASRVRRRWRRRTLQLALLCAAIALVAALMVGSA